MPDDDLRIGPGCLRPRRAAQSKPFLAQLLAAVQKAGGLPSGRRPRRGLRSTFGRGRVASLIATRFLNDRARSVVVKARIIRRVRFPGALRAHIRYLKRDGVTRDGTPGKLFDAARDETDVRAFARRCDGDRHHFQFIVSPYEASELASLRGFARELMDQASRDLDTELDWVAADHWNTAHPHLHILIGGRTDDGADLVISRDYMTSGLRARARDLVTLELGPRPELKVRQGLQPDITAERWTRLDRVLAREAEVSDRVIDLRPAPEAARDPEREIRIGRMRTLERLCLAEPAGPARWVLAADVEPRLRALGRQADIIRRLEETITRDGACRAPWTWDLEGERHGDPVIGRLMARGLDDEISATVFAVVDGADGRVHHLKLADIDAAGDGPIGGIVELRRLDDASGEPRIELAVCCDLDLKQQVAAEGATWLDWQLVAGEPAELSRAGFGAEVRAALDQRVRILIERGLACRDGDKVMLDSNLIETLRHRELDHVGRRLAEATGLAHVPSEPGELVTGVYRQRLSLASGRFAMIDDGRGFKLVPWIPPLERELERQVSGIAGPDGVDWSFGRRRGLSL